MKIFQKTAIFALVLLVSAPLLSAKRNKQTASEFIFEGTPLPGATMQKTEFSVSKFSPFEKVYLLQHLKRPRTKDETQSLLKNEFTVHWLDDIKKSQIRPRHYLYATEDEPTTPRETGSFFSDLMYPFQWYLNNRENPGNDINVIPVWKAGNYGKGVHVCIVDDGIQTSHPDFSDNIVPSLSYDFNNSETNITAKNGLRHGTRCTGQIVSNRNNDICGVGVAPEATVSGIQILSKDISEPDIARAILFKKEKINIYSCSWGPLDDGRTVEGPGKVVLRAFIEGVLRGRGGLGSIYLFATGNGARQDNCNFDGYVNTVFTIGIGAIDAENEIPVYSEECAAQLAVTYSSNEKKAIATTDINGGCTKKHGGTSAAVPIVAGIYALVLSARPDLTWRDIAALTVHCAVPFDTSRTHWQKNSAGKWFSNFAGFGKFDAELMVETAKTWEAVGPLLPKPQPTQYTSLEMQYGDGELCAAMHLEEWQTDGIVALESVTVAITLESTRRGALEISLVSPAGTVSRLAGSRERDTSTAGLVDWSLASQAFWGERPAGKWMLCVGNKTYQEHSGRLVSWRMTLWGETTKETLDEYTEKMDYETLLLLPYFPPSQTYFDEFSPYYHKTENIKAQEQKEAPKQKPQLKTFAALLLFIAALFCFILFLEKKNL
ncbi:MAG: kexin [Amphiamblys sp. WSBS2006]|nr:MAG: kexin [Amphiamblys sp. WSBS2006]